MRSWATKAEAVSVRRQLYDLLQSMTDYDPVPRIRMCAAYFDSLPPEDVPAAERRMLAFTLTYKAMIESGPKGTLDEFFAAVDEAERGLVN